MANYSHARISYDVALGRTLDVSGVVVDEALKGQMTSIVSKPRAEEKQ